MKKAVLKVSQSLSPQSVEQIKEGFEKLLGAKPDFSVEKSPELIGGFVAFVDSRVYDASVSTQLKKISHLLKDSAGNEGAEKDS